MKKMGSPIEHKKSVVVRKRTVHKESRKDCFRRLKRNLPVLSLMSKSTPKEFAYLMHVVNDDALTAMCNCIYNVLNELELPRDQLEKLKASSSKYAAKLRYLAATKGASKKRRKIAKQSGGAIAALLMAALPLVTNLISGLFKK